MRTNMEYDPYDYKEVPSDPYVIDLTNCKTHHGVHLAIKNGLGFPDYYGENLSALWDSGYDFCCGRPITVEIHGTATLPHDAKTLFERCYVILVRIQEEFPEAVFKIVS